MMFEYKMDDIAALVTAYETLKIYRDLILTFRRWLQSSAIDCSTLCGQTFPLEGFANRFHAIDKQLTMTNHSTHDYYRELKFPYYNPFNISVCFSYCKMPTQISWHGFLLTMIPLSILSFAVLKHIIVATMPTMMILTLSMVLMQIMLTTLIILMMGLTWIIAIMATTVITLTTLTLVPTLKMVRTLTIVTTLIVVINTDDN